MNVCFGEDALSDPRCFRHLTAMWWGFFDGRHRWIVQREEIVESSDWLRAEGARIQLEIKRQLRVAGRDPSIRRVLVRSEDEPPRLDGTTWHLPASVAQQWLDAPIAVLVENARVDGAFLRLVLLRVGERKLRRRLGDEPFLRLRNRWTTVLGDGILFAVRHGGGSETATQLELLMEVSRGPAPRLFVLVDSDKDSPTGALGRTALAVQDSLAQVRANPTPGLHVLEKHEVENYLPHKAIFTEFRSRAVPDPEFGDLKEVFAKDLARRVFESPAADAYLHDSALRERCGNGGRELDTLVGALCDLL